MTPKQQFYDLAAKTLIKNLEKRGMEGYFCPDRQSAVQKALELMPKGSSIGWGGSMTLTEAGLIDAVKAGDYKVIDRTQYKTKEEVQQLKRELITCDYFLMSTNAISMDGQLVNIDGTANRVAYLCYGPENVIILASMNKLAPDLDSALSRARHLAAPPNNVRLKIGNPCTLTGKCSDCLSDTTICCQFVITRFSKPKGRIKVILIGEEMGL